MEAPRSENEIFRELEILCASPGYIHAIAYFCFRDNTIKYAEEMSVENVLQQFNKTRLVRTEISTVIGLALKNELDTSHPHPKTLQHYADKTEELLEEIHQSMLVPVMEDFKKGLESGGQTNPFESGAAIRESIFYGGEAAYNFQYRDLFNTKYKDDNKWFVENKKFSIDQASLLVKSIGTLQNEKLANILDNFKRLHPNEWSFLPAFKLTTQEISENSLVDIDTTRAFLEAFSLPPVLMKEFLALDDFNASNAFPIIKVKDDDYIIFQNYSLNEALYETPFFWLNGDDSYKNIAREHRGDFTENFSTERLRLVFGESNVHTNIDIYKSKKERVGEIDVLVTYADRAIVLQAKSKKLTIAARKGNSNLLRDDFKKAIQDANDQAFLCASFLLDETYTLVDSEKNELKISRKIKEIYPFCVVSEHYPALSFQSRQFLSHSETEIIKPPLIMDVFLLDVMTEMLHTPLHFLSYINKRSHYSDKILVNHELTTLSYHLKRNLWLETDYTMMHLEDDICADLDLAMLARREGVPGAKTPEGILTKYKGTFFDNLVQDIETLAIPDTIDLGFMLLAISGETIEQINDGVSRLTKRFHEDGKPHNLTLGIKDSSTGLTIHCNDYDIYEAGTSLQRYCTLRKYEQKAQSWFGICVSPKNQRIKLGLSLSYNWERSDEMDQATKTLAKPQYLTKNPSINYDTIFNRKVKKPGKNVKCPCGSGKKFRKCCRV
ncbi:prepilin peptidase [Pseudomonas protegens]|uniref:YecA/YgfB family protein n=1 Tax=Pseudomonas protegens TaxID=380021 RepID=UPI000F4C2F48|nr:SEC-C metal-binding domain-containing protein [Pseudomonas protegens]ROL66729.1 prepilin peptidase [Pseudomonas protegens]